MSTEQTITDDLDAILNVLPPHLQNHIREINRGGDLLEVIVDLGRSPEARYVGEAKNLNSREVNREDIDFVVSRIGEFTADNRAGIPRTLHRISCIRNRQGKIVGLTCRVGRAVYGTIEIIRDIVESGKSILLLGRPGVGKCITGDSWIWTTDGLERLADLIPHTLAEDQFAPIHLRVQGKESVEVASHAYNGGQRETLRLTTRQGYSLEGTPEHPILTLTVKGELAFQRLDQLTLGEYVAIQRGQQLFGTTSQLPALEFIARTNALDGQLPGEMTEELARFLGYLVAEGTLSFDNQVTFSNTDPEVQKDMTHLTRLLFGLELRPHLHRGEWNGKDFRIFGVKLRRFLTHLGLTLGLAANKQIPSCILKAPKPIVTAFLRALFEGDGSVYGPDGRIEISSASRELVSQLHLLLLNYGMVGNLRAKYNPDYDRDYHVLTLLGENLVRFGKEIGFISTTKQNKLAHFLSVKGESRHNPNLDVIPFQNDRLRKLRTPVGTTSQTFYRFTKSDNRAPSYRTLQSILAEAQRVADYPDYQTLKELVHQNYYFDPIKAIEASENYVYDLTIPGSHSFLANGFVCHNTTMLRESARVLGDTKRVIIVDTSNEIGGDGDIPHPAIGNSRRMQVPTPSLQHEVMIEAVENHMPEVIVIDEIGRELEAEAARTIAERGVQLIATAHGNSLDNLMMNPTLADLIGGIQSVTLSDEEARRRGTQKSILERKAPPTFDVVVEIQERNRLAVHHDVGDAVDAFLRGRALPAEIRIRDADGQVHIEKPQISPRVALTMRATKRSETRAASEPGRAMRILPYGVSQERLEQAAKSLQVPLQIVNDAGNADGVLTLKNFYRKRPPIVTDAERRGVPVYVLRSNTLAQMQGLLEDLFGVDGQGDRDPTEDALQEAQDAIDQILQGAHSVELAPQSAYARRQQHELARKANLFSRSIGKEPRRRVRIYGSEVG